MSRSLAVLAAVPLFLVLAVAAARVDDLPAVALAKVTEGGLWTGLAAFLVLAVVLALRPKPVAQSRASAKVR